MGKKEQKKEYRLPTKASLIIRAVAGGYILYLAYSIIEGLGDETRNNQLIFGAFAAAFIIGGLFFILTSLKAIRDGKFQGGELDPHKDEEAAAAVTEQKRIEFGETLEDEEKDNYMQTSGKQETDPKDMNQ
jgi:hypothetical protein